MALVIDDAPWASDHVEATELDDALAAFADLVTAVRARDIPVQIFQDLWDFPLVGQDTLMALLFDEANPRGLSRDVRQRLALLFDRLSGSALDIGVLCDLEAEVAGLKLLSPALVYAWQCGQQRSFVGCLTPASSGRKGCSPVLVRSKSQEVYFICDEVSLGASFRFAISQENADETRFAELAQNAFPQLAFVATVWGGLRDMSIGFRERRDDLIRHFTVLNDDGARIFGLSLNHAVQKGFAEKGINISLETSQTMLNATCRRAREREFANQTLIFEWHMKIELHRDRIHVHPGIRESDGKVIVGIIHQHLPLPGD